MKYGSICGGIFTFQITDMADSHGTNITDNLRSYYKWLEVTGNTNPMCIELILQVTVKLIEDKQEESEQRNIW